MDRLASKTAQSLKLLSRAALLLAMLAAPVLAMPMMRADSGHTIEAPASKNSGVGFVLMVSLQRG